MKRLTCWDSKGVPQLTPPTSLMTIGQKRTHPAESGVNEIKHVGHSCVPGQTHSGRKRSSSVMRPLSSRSWLPLT